ncbi:MAG: hypothetical protein ACOX05_03805 [Bacillota bacterium]|jgi:hypothetical protein
MKKFWVLILLIACFVLGLNATAAGMHSLLPEAPAAVIGFEWREGQMVAYFLDYEYHF